MTKLNSRVPAELDRIIGKALEKDPDLRFQPAAELRADLKRFRRDMASAPRQEPAKAGGGKAAVAGAALEVAKSLAVLYFENPSGAKEDEYFRDGITEDIITELSRMADLWVFTRSAVLNFRDKEVMAQRLLTLPELANLQAAKKCVWPLGVIIWHRVGQAKRKAFRLDPWAVG